MRAAVLLLGLALATASATIADDRDQPASIESDRAEIDRESGVSRYFGNVVFIQGSLQVHGDYMEVRTAGGTIERIEVTGEPGRVEQTTEAGDRIHARARSIIYLAAEPLVTLTGSAEVVRGGDRFTASRIRYRPDSGRIEAERTDETDERVRIIIVPGSDAESAGDE